jgi:hypothetical protein
MVMIRANTRDYIYYVVRMTHTAISKANLFHVVSGHIITLDPFFYLFSFHILAFIYWKTDNETLLKI